MAEEFKTYLDTVDAQVRWKRARPALRRELRTHLEEQKADCMAAGMREADAEAEAVRQMGDAQTVGQALDAVHRPKKQMLLLIPAAARACAGLAVLGLRPMDTSQYAAMGASRGGYLAALAVLLVLAAGLPLWLWGSFAPLAAAAGYGLAVWYGYRNLDGMSGDISGFALTLGELCGCAAAILWR